MSTTNFTKDGVKAYQKFLDDSGFYSPPGYDLNVDGDPGDDTTKATGKLLDVLQEKTFVVHDGPVSSSDSPLIIASASVSSASFAEVLASIAESQIGTQEDANHSNRGSAILKYQEATSLGGQGWPWCAAFVDWCVKQVGSTVTRPKAFLNPDTASAFGLITWADDQGLKVFNPDQGKPQRGDIVVYTFSHTGIVTGYTGGTNFSAVEGNTNDQGGSDGYEVARRTRSFGLVKAFIWFA